MLPTTDTKPHPCKICGAAAPLLGVVDFHKSCLQAEGKVLPLSGIPIYYRRCAKCGFVFTDAFDDWSPQAFARRLYNDDYKIVDPEYIEGRPTKNVENVGKVFGKIPAGTTLLDFGGGSGKFAELMTATGVKATSYDPYSPNSRRPEGTFDLITCFEVLEHSPAPHDTLAAIASFLNKDGAIFFSTLRQPKDFPKQGVNWWYVAPRNGHISIHSATSLGLLFKRARLNLVSINDAYHLAFRTVSPLIAPLIKRAKPAEAAAKV